MSNALELRPRLSSPFVLFSWLIEPPLFLLKQQNRKATGGGRGGGEKKKHRQNAYPQRGKAIIVNDPEDKKLVFIEMMKEEIEEATACINLRTTDNNEISQTIFTSILKLIGNG